MARVYMLITIYDMYIYIYKMHINIEKFSSGVINTHNITHRIDGL